MIYVGPKLQGTPGIFPRKMFKPLNHPIHAQEYVEKIQSHRPDLDCPFISWIWTLDDVNLFEVDERTDI